MILTEFLERGKKMRTDEYWQTEAHNKTMLEAIRDFCRTNWPDDRRARRPDENGVFKLIGGNNTYQCYFVDNIPGVWRIKRIS